MYKSAVLTFLLFVIGAVALLFTQKDVFAQSNDRVLMFVAYNDVWWAEYKVLYEGLIAAGYDVDVRSSGTGEAYTYGNMVDADANAISSYSAFTDTFLANFGGSWDASWNTPDNIPLDGRIQDVADMDEYVALVIPGGTGAREYRYDGTYGMFGPVGHEASAVEVQESAEKLNQLINEAIADGKPVSAQCHAATLAPFARIPGTAGSGFDGLGLSVLDGKYATGYHLGDGDTATQYANLNITYLANEKLVIDGPEATDLGGNLNGRDTIITTRDWYPQTVSHAGRTLLNMLESYPTPADRTRTLDVLVFGGGEPNHYNDPAPAYYTDLVPLFNDASDEFNFVTTATNLTSDLTTVNLANYDVLVYFRHTDIPQSAEDAIVQFVDDGGGLVGIHHAIWNPGFSNNTLIDLFGGELPQGVSLGSELGLVYWGEENHLISVNHGEFVSTWGVLLNGSTPTETTQYDPAPSLDPLPNVNDDGDIARGYWHFTIPANDELYLGARFNANANFGRGVGEINRLFANDRFNAGSPNPNNGNYDYWGWTKQFDGDANLQIGRIVYLQPGETLVRTFAHDSYLQTVKNAIVWSAGTTVAPTAVSEISGDVNGDSAVPLILILILLTMFTLFIRVPFSANATNFRS